MCEVKIRFPDRKSYGIVVDNCGESSFQRDFAWRYERRIIDRGVLAEALCKS